MKTILKLVITLSVFFISNYFFGQTPEGVNYQATVRDASGNLMISQNVAIIFKINQTTMGGTTIYSETHSVTTSAFGSFSATIGQGTATSGVFASINWSETDYFLNVNVDGNDLGTSQLMSVPYALHSKTADNVKNPIWKKRNSNGDYYSNGETIIIGDSTANANSLTVRNNFVTGGFGEMVDFVADTMSPNSDILNMQTSTETPDNTQFIECNKGGLKFSVNTDGSVFSKKQIKTDSSLIVGDEVNRVATGSANLIPIAYGSVNMNGTLGEGTGNFSVSKTSLGTYRITVAGVNYSLADYVVQVSVQYGAVYSNFYESAGKMVVEMNSFSGVNTDASFHFVIYKP